MSCLLGGRGAFSLACGALRRSLGACMGVAPAAAHTRSNILGNESHSAVDESDQGSAFNRRQPVLEVQHGGERHEKRTPDLEQRRPLDRLHVAPEMPVVPSEVTE